MTYDSDTGCANEPESRRKGRGPKSGRNCNDEERSVQLRGSSAPATELEIISLQLADSEHATDYEADDEEKPQVGDQAVDAEHDENGGIVARKVAQVVVDSALYLAKVGGLGNALEVEELGNWSQVGESRGDGGIAQAVEAPTEVHPGCQGIDGDAEARHDGGCVGCSLRGR